MPILKRLSAYKQYREWHPTVPIKQAIQTVDSMFNRPHISTIQSCQCVYCVYDRGESFTNPYVHYKCIKAIEYDPTTGNYTEVTHP